MDNAVETTPGETSAGAEPAGWIYPSGGAGWACLYLDRPDGARLRLGCWQSGKSEGRRGTCLLVNGRSEFLEKYAEQAAEWAARGWRVVSFDWRGQGLSTRPLPNRQLGHIDDFSTYLEDLEAIMAALCPPTGPVVAFAHSMGGHLMLRHVLDCDTAMEVPRLKALILSAAMVQINTAPLPGRVAALIANLACRQGKAEAYAPGQRDFDPDAQRFEGNPLTSDPRRFKVALDACRQQQDLCLGGVTYGWLAAAYRSTDYLAHATMSGLDLPIQILAAGADRIVSSPALRALARRLPDARFHNYPGARHELMMENDAIRRAVWEDVDHFLEETGL
ncbi:alpha/beta fold hydrolase [Nitrospirillum amazonense]|uniref:Lysophospholipase n=1 Tax=Nitrospirillum amazonense TaxID=28077 RepID=A0A560JC03_9PROT|nr:alpha/beta hydrolase [Nitrospirillum amazonense]MDG3440929.1 alpha/beta hydrolase [Nitrospirillum amazonense]TWB68019.1 lysophospholipase [Nitrospirillum amazonense]